MNQSKWQNIRSCLTTTVLIAGLGYFVDLFDITLFGVVRTASLKDLGITDPQQILADGLSIYNWGMVGMMIGGLLWGILADKRGRLSVMFASILLYSLSNIANAFVWNTPSYIICRFFGGIGLAGELGAAISLVAESLPKEKRGIGTTIVATLGMSGILVASVVGQLIPWRMAYALGGLMGFALLLARLKMFESGLFEKSTHENIERGNFFMLLKPARFLRYLTCILAGVPIYFTTGILFTFAPELTASLNVQGPVTAGNAILFGSIGLTIGDLLSGVLSQTLKSRKKAISACLGVGLLTMLAYTNGHGFSNHTIYTLCFVIGTAVGYWAVLITTAAEQFGTNLRGTVSTTVPNFVRGSAVLVTLGFAHLKVQIGISNAVLMVGCLCFAIALVSVSLMKETFHADLDYFERD